MKSFYFKIWSAFVFCQRRCSWVCARNMEGITDPGVGVILSHCCLQRPKCSGEVAGVKSSASVKSLVPKKSLWRVNEIGSVFFFLSFTFFNFWKKIEIGYVFSFLFRSFFNFWKKKTNVDFFALSHWPVAFFIMFWSFLLSLLICCVLCAVLPAYGEWSRHLPIVPQEVLERRRVKVSDIFFFMCASISVYDPIQIFPYFLYFQ